MHLGDVGDRRRPCRCRSPRSAHRRRPVAVRRSPGQRGVELRRDGAPPRRPASRTAIALADAQDDAEPGGQRRLGLGADLGVALALVRAALAMADDGQPRARHRPASPPRCSRYARRWPRHGHPARRSRSPAAPAPRARSGSRAGTARHRRPASSAAPRRSRRPRPDRRRVPFIFQLPATSLRRIAVHARRRP